MLLFPITHKKMSIFGEKYTNYSLSESIIFFQFLVIAQSLTAFTTMLFLIIEGEITQILIAMFAASTAINFLLFFQTQRLKLHIQNILAAVYILYVAALIIFMISDITGPLFLVGYCCGIYFLSIIQFCNPKVKLLFVLVTPWIIFAFSNVFVLSYLNYIVYTLSASSLMGLLTYLFQVKQECIYSQSIIIKNQQEIIKQFTSDNLFAISYDDRNNQFKLEFANASFENLQDDFKETLRIYEVVPDIDSINQKKNYKPETLEEYLFQYNKDELNFTENSYFNLKIKHIYEEKLQDITILRTYLDQSIFVISIKSTSSDLLIEKYEIKMSKLKDKIISISSDTGTFLQSQYHSLNQLKKNECQNQQRICEVQQSNILRMINQMRNYLIYFQSQKLQILQASIKNYKLQIFQHAILSYFEIQSKLNSRYFLNTTQTSLYDNYQLKNSQSLLTQILLNVFNAILALSSIKSTIRFSVSNENSQCKQFKNTQRSQTINKFFNSKESSQIATLQFKFTFTSDTEIENLESILCAIKHEQKEDTEQVIISSVNYLILRIIGPYNEIHMRMYQTQELDKYFNEVSFDIYLDQTQLDNSYINQNQVQREI